jgi:proteasome lid subunit RPN8/RPN11
VPLGRRLIVCADEMVFDEVRYREPRRLRRPDRDPERACVAVGEPRPSDLPIFLDWGAADAIERHALSDTSVELGGILLGCEAIDPHSHESFVWVTQSLAARHYENTQSSFTYTHDSWEEITRERDQRFPDLDIVGWYHTHPDFGIFLSSMDLFIHEHFFPQPLQVAYVVDPIRQHRGFFQWREGKVEAVGGFFLTGKRAERPVLARLANELEHLPTGDPGAGGGGLSPRLEAQLMAMLNRSNQPVVVSAGGSPLLGGLLGVLLGMLAVAGWLGIASLSRSVQEQARAVGRLEEAVTAREAVAAEARAGAKEQALDALLREVKLGGGAEPVLAAYQRVVSERDAARLAQTAAATDKDALNLLASRLRAERQGLEKALGATRAQAEELRAEVDTTVQAQKARIEELTAELAEQERLVVEAGADVLDRKYRIAWFVAAVAIAASVLLGLGLVYAIARRAPAAVDAPLRVE